MRDESPEAANPPPLPRRLKAYAYIRRGNHLRIYRQNMGKRAISWEVCQKIKNIVFGPESVCYEAYPAESEVMNHANIRHLWRVESLPHTLDLKKALQNPEAVNQGIKPIQETER